jgi:hypothetical protein
MSREQENKLLATRFIILVDRADMVIMCSPTINVAIFYAIDVSTERKVITRKIMYCMAGKDNNPLIYPVCSSSD